MSPRTLKPWQAYKSTKGHTPLELKQALEQQRQQASSPAVPPPDPIPQLPPQPQPPQPAAQPYFQSPPPAAYQATPANPIPPGFPSQPATGPQPPQPAGGVPGSPYEFMMSPGQSASKVSLTGGNSQRGRIALVVGGLFILLIVIIISKSLFGGGSSFTPYITVGQDQQELIHLSTAAGLLQSGISTSNQNFAATTQLSVSSAQGSLIKYLANNGQKVSSKTLALRTSTSLDNQLVAAIAAATYDQIFQQIMSGQLNTYMGDLRQAYRQTKGVNGHALLNSDYNQAQLLLTQLNQPAGS